MEKIICMRKLSVIFAILVLIPFAGKAQNSLNSRPDSVLGVFLVPEKGNDSKVEFTKNADGRLCLKGTVLGIGETAYWTRVK